MKRIYLARDTRSDIEYNKYVGWKLLPTKKGNEFVKNVVVIDKVISAYVKEKVDLRVIDITKQAIWVEVI